jgi:hypothetical protein
VTIAAPTIAVTPTSAPTAAPTTKKSSDDDDMTLIIVLICLGVVILLIAGAVLACYYRNKASNAFSWPSGYGHGSPIFCAARRGIKSAH